MKNIYTLTLYFLAVTFYAQNENPFDFYPLNIGNEWHYDVKGVYYFSDLDTIYTSQSYKVIGDTLMSNGKNYFVIERDRKDVQGRKFVDWFFLYVDSVTTRVYIYEDDGTDGRIVDSLACRAGDFFLHSNHCESVIADTILNFPTTTKYITMDMPDLSQHHILAKDIGVVYEYDGGGWGYDEYRTLYYAKIDGKEYGTIVSVEKKSEQPANFMLYQNYPNPFNPSTTIKYSISEGGFVKLTVYDILGKKIEDLVNENKLQGNYSVTFDGKNLISGIYYYRFQTNNYSEVKKMLMLK